MLNSKKYALLYWSSQSFKYYESGQPLDKCLFQTKLEAVPFTPCDLYQTLGFSCGGLKCV
jgi:hypothetical protein